jgi:hypothetical protein
MAVRLHSRAAIILSAPMNIRWRFDPTNERWRYDVRLFLLAYIFGLIAFSAVIPG